LGMRPVSLSPKNTLGGGAATRFGFCEINGRAAMQSSCFRKAKTRSRACALYRFSPKNALADKSATRFWVRSDAWLKYVK
jgi:hypothetical protein